MKDYYDTHKYSIFDIFPRSNKFYLKSNNTCKELVIYGTNIESNVGTPKFTSIVNYMINLPDDIYYILSGIILSDGYIKTTFNNKTRKFIKGEYMPQRDGAKVSFVPLLKTTYNSRFSLKQSIQHIEYLLYTYNKLAHYCISPPKIKVEPLKGKLFTAITFDTRALPCFSTLRDTFYQGRTKIIPENIYDLINYESLAHMIMGDGSLSRGSGLILNFQSYTVKELILLINVFKIK